MDLSNENLTLSAFVFVLESLKGDRLRLPASWLSRLFPQESNLESVIVFEISTEHGKTFGVPMDFTSADERVGISKALAASLGVLESESTLQDSSGEQLLAQPSESYSQNLYESMKPLARADFKRVRLPKGTFVKLSPLSADYMDIDDIRYSFLFF